MNIKNIIQLLLQSSSDFNKLHDYVITELSKAVNKSVNEANPEELFKIAKTCTPTEKDRVQALLDAYNNAVLSLIKQGITKAVLFSTNTQQNALSAFTRFEGKEVDAWRKETARAFIESRMKRDHGLNLSDRVWNYTQQTKSEFEVAVSQVLANGIGKGISAESLGRQVRQYLNNPDMMYRRYHRKQLMSDGTKKDIVEWRRRVIDKEGKVRFIKEDLAKVGPGVYRSARQNALRLTITETNMAYNYSNCKRWESEPFVLGIRIRLSANHPEEDICDELAGDYPKTFMWRGWHPRCMCSVSPILMDRKSDEWKKLRKMPKEEYEAYQSPNLVKNVPSAFSEWCERNKKKLKVARDNDKLPYFVKDNKKVVGDLLGWKEKQIVKPISSREKILAAAKARHEARTDKQINDILTRWDERKYTSAQKQNFKVIENKMGLKRGISMDFEKANQGKGNIDYKSGLTAFRVNCQSSVVAHELRMRGFDVTAQPNLQKGDDPNKLSHGTWKCWIKADGTPFEMPERFAYKISKNGNYIGLPYKETIQQINEHTKAVGRYHVSFGWKGEKYGHIVTMERKADGTALWYDPQTGQRDFFDKEYVKKIKGVRAYRVDNLSFDILNWNVVRPIGNRNFMPQPPKGQTAGTKAILSSDKSSIIGTRVNLSKNIIEYRNLAMSEILKINTIQKLHDGELKYSKSSLKRSIVHAKNKEEVDMFKYVVTHPKEMLFCRKSIFGEVKDVNNKIDLRNLERKRKRGVIHYNEYELQKNDEVWLIKTEVYKNGIEIPYNIRLK
jgi:hypothetical protein